MRTMIVLCAVCGEAPCKPTFVKCARCLVVEQQERARRKQELECQKGTESTNSMNRCRATSQLGDEGSLRSHGRRFVKQNIEVAQNRQLTRRALEDDINIFSGQAPIHVACIVCGVGQCVIAELTCDKCQAVWWQEVLASPEPELDNEMEWRTFEEDCIVLEASIPTSSGGQDNHVAFSRPTFRDCRIVGVNGAPTPKPGCGTLTAFAG